MAKSETLYWLGEDYCWNLKKALKEEAIKELNLSTKRVLVPGTVKVEYSCALTQKEYETHLDGDHKEFCFYDNLLRSTTVKLSNEECRWGVLKEYFNHGVGISVEAVLECKVLSFKSVKTKKEYIKELKSLNPYTWERDLETYPWPL